MVYLTLQSAVVNLAAFVGFSAEKLFKIVVGSNYGIAFSLLADKALSHNLVKPLGGLYVEQSFSVGRIGDNRCVALGLYIVLNIADGKGYPIPYAGDFGVFPCGFECSAVHVVAFRAEFAIAVFP